MLCTSPRAAVGLMDEQAFEQQKKHQLGMYRIILEPEGSASINSWFSSKLVPFSDEQRAATLHRGPGTG